MKKNHNKLYGRLREKRITQVKLAKLMKMSYQTINYKLTGKNPFTINDIDKLVEILEIPVNEIGEYFFTNEGD